MTPSIENDVRAFWQWFSSVAQELSANLENDRILRELDRRVTSFGRVTWEVGPGLEEPNALVISPNGDRELLSLSARIVSLAPTIAEWEFHAAKPPKKWNLRFVISDVDGRPIEVDANDWQYVLLKLPDGSFDVVVRAQNLENLHEDTKQLAADVAVEGVVGEMSRLESIGNIEVVRDFNDIDRRKSTALRHLADHLGSLTSH